MRETARALFLGLALAATGPAVAAEVGAASSLVLGPDVAWRSLPTGGMIARAYPRQAMLSNIEGRATIVCVLSDALLLEACQVQSEEPAAHGFGAATLQLSKGFIPKTRQTNPRVVPGAQVEIKMRFVLPRG